MSDNTALGDRMKRYEAVTKNFLPRRTCTILRVGGKAFHTLLRNADKPFDGHFMAMMDETMRVLCKEVSGTVFAYTQSDEISLLLTDFASIHTEPWFGGNVQKVVSVAASAATAAFNDRAVDAAACHGKYFPGMAMFDARVFTIPDPVEVANYFLWRQRDAVRNSVSMAAQAAFPHKQLQNLNGNQLQEKLFAEKGINWNDYPVRARRGAVCVKKTIITGPEETDDIPDFTFRTKWEAEEAPHFTAQPDGFLASIIPEIPSFGK